MNNPRKSPRAPWIDYDAGLFFITICTKNHIHYFGKIADGCMRLSQTGEMVSYELSNPGIHHPEIEIPLFVVMPNHIHAIVGVNRLMRNANMECDMPPDQRNPNPYMRANRDMARHVPTLSKYVASFKSVITKNARMTCKDFGWQTRYHDHLIRNSREGNIISQYIINNPLNWDKDCFNC